LHHFIINFYQQSKTGLHSRITFSSIITWKIW